MRKNSSTKHKDNQRQVKNGAEPTNGLATQQPLFCLEEPDMPAERPESEAVLSESQTRSQTSAELAPMVKVPFALSLLALSCVPGLGRKGIAALADNLGQDLAGVWQSDCTAVHAVLAKAQVPAAERIAAHICDKADDLLQIGEEQVDALSQRNIHVVAGPELPVALRTIPQAPRWLFVQGDPRVLHARPAVAIVGTREPTEEGIRATTQVTRLVATYPITVVSGLATGIDEEAHRVSLQEQRLNVAFLGHGINVVFPVATQDLRAQIVEQGGAVATEYLPNEKYQKSYFVERNRLQAALADIVIPVEARATGGTAHTIRFARQYQRGLLGIRFPGVNGILPELEAAGVPVFDVSSPQEVKRLDRTLRELAEANGHTTFPLDRHVRLLRRDIRYRYIRPDDVRQLIATLEELVKEVSSDGE